MKSVEDGVGRLLGEPLHPEVAVGGDGADNVARLVHRSDNQAERRAAAQRHNHVAEVVRLR